MRRGATHHRHIPTQRSSGFHIVPVAPHLVTYVPLLLPLSKPLSFDTHVSVLSDRLFPPLTASRQVLPRSNSCSSPLQGRRRNSSRQVELRISSLVRLAAGKYQLAFAALLTLSHLSELSPHFSSCVRHYLFSSRVEERIAAFISKVLSEPQLRWSPYPSMAPQLRQRPTRCGQDLTRHSRDP